MNDKTQIFIDTQDMEARYAEELYKDYIREQYNKLQSNWNSLRKLLINEKKLIEEDEFFCNLSNKDYIEFILDKMNELEGKDNNE